MASQGSQYTSKEFTDYCSDHNITQSMSRAGCPYDNAPMERYFNTLKSELIYQHSYTSEDKLFADIDDYVLLWYNSVRPHSFNNGLTPWQKRMAWSFWGKLLQFCLTRTINKGHKYKRAFVIGWFNCVDSFAQLIQLGSGAGSRPLINEARVAYFPFLRRNKSPTRTTDLAYNYDRAYSELSLDLICESDPNCNCLFLGNQKDVFHFAVYY